jgi:hypothetical protein
MISSFGRTKVVDLTGEFVLRHPACHAPREIDGAGEVDPMTGLCHLHAKSGGEMGLAGAGRSKEDHAALLDETQRREFLDEASINRGLSGEIEILDALQVRQLRELQGQTHGVRVSLRQLRIEQVAQEMRVRPA